MSQPTLRLFDGYPHTSPRLKPQVKLLQQELQKEGYHLQPDGFFGQGTEAIVKQFQAEKGILADGIVGPVTWIALIEDIISSPTEIFATSYKAEDKNMKKHHTEALKYKEFILKQSKKFDIAPAIICGIGSRESAWGAALTPKGPKGTGDFAKRRFPTRYREAALPAGETGFGRGLMQIDFDAHEFARTGNWQNAEENIKYGCMVYNDARNYMKNKTQLTGLSLIRATLAAYNCGAGRVITTLNENLDIDYFTAGRDYSKDTLNRAGYFQLLGW